MLDRLTKLAADSLRHDYPDIEQIRILDLEETGGHASAPQWNVRLTWLAGRVRHLNTYVARSVPGQADPARLAELGRRLSEAGVPVPALIGASTDPSESLLLFEAAPGQPAAQVLRRARMRWQMSALAVTLARALAHLHRLDWSSVAPWLADPDALPEDAIDEQVNDLMNGLATRAERLPTTWREAVSRALAWLDLRRPVTVSLCLCHGNFGPDTVMLDQDEVSALYGWEHVHVSDAASDLALLPYQTRQLGLPSDDADLFLQTLLASYLQLSPRSLENLPFFVVARLTVRALDAAEAAFTSSPSSTLDAAVLVTEHLTTLRRAMEFAEFAPWQAG